MTQPSRSRARRALLPNQPPTKIRWFPYLPVLFVGALVWQGCQDAQQPEPEPSEPEFHGQNEPPAPGAVLPGTDLEAFAEAEEAFGEVEGIDEGLGPIFNERGCASCHTTPVAGGSGEQFERRFGTFANGEFYAYDRDPDNHGGTLRQLFSVGTYATAAGQVCEIPVEVEAAGATVNNVGRRTQPLFGLGLVDAMPDRFFEALARRQDRDVRGVVQYVPVALPDPRDPGQSLGSLRVGRFGWKGQVPSLLQFSGDAYTNEMGITTQSCFRGETILAFAFENFRNNVPPPEGCQGGDLAPLQPAHQDVPAFADDVVGPCDGDLTEIQDDLLLFTLFMESLAPPPRDRGDNSWERREIERGEQTFEEIGCADCHVSTTFVTPRTPFNGVPGGYRFTPYSDFLAHDMGSLGDRIGNTGDSERKTRRMRTQPLWGARFNTSFLHDGRAADIPAAILAHDGQAERARRRYERLRRGEQEALVRFVLSL
jgi:hypothetical protein